MIQAKFSIKRLRERAALLNVGNIQLDSCILLVFVMVRLLLRILKIPVLNLICSTSAFCVFGRSNALIKKYDDKNTYLEDSYTVLFLSSLWRIKRNYLIDIIIIIIIIMPVFYAMDNKWQINPFIFHNILMDVWKIYTKAIQKLIFSAIE